MFYIIVSIKRKEDFESKSVGTKYGVKTLSVLYILVDDVYCLLALFLVVFSYVGR